MSCWDLRVGDHGSVPGAAGWCAGGDGDPVAAAEQRADPVDLPAWLGGDGERELGGGHLSFFHLGAMIPWIFSTVAWAR